MKVAVVYWSGTGNTETMAMAVAKGAKSGNANVDVFQSTDFSAAKMDEYDAVAFGCPAMGSEELEEDEFKPFYESVMQSIGDKKVALFGSYGWGDGEWMRNWEQEVSSNLVTSGLIVNGGASDIDDASYEEFINALK